MEVQHPFQAPDPVFSDDICLILTIHVHPGHTITNMEIPGFAIIGSFPFIGNIGQKLAIIIVREQCVNTIRENVKING